MGAILSTLQHTVQGLKSVLALLSSLSAEFNAALQRSAESPGLPTKTPSDSYWLRDPPFPELVHAGSPELPPTADVVIIGSGIAGAAIAWSLLHERRRLGSLGRVVVVDARALCSGATARNGGHIKATSYEAFSQLRKRFSQERAVALTRFQARHLDCLTALCEAEGLDQAEARVVETADLYLDEATFQASVQGIADAKSCMPELEIGIWDQQEAKKKFGVNDSVVGALTYRAGAIWAYRFVVSIWKRLLDEFGPSLSLETNTPVESIGLSPDGPPEFPYALKTPCGILHARHVVHATNAFAGHLIPGLRGKVTGVKAHMSAQKPGDKFPSHDGNTSWSVVYGGAFDYVTQRPSSSSLTPGDLMIGGGFTRSLKQGVDQVGVYDDGSRLDPLTASHIMGIFPAIFSPNWGTRSEVKQAWSGILGMTGDLLPLVGRLDEAWTQRKPATKNPGLPKHKVPGEWIAAGFCGEGMVWAWLCGVALGVMVAGSAEENLPEMPGRPGGKLRDWFPEELIISHQRMRNADVSNLANHM